MKCNAGFAISRSLDIDIDKYLFILSDINEKYKISKELICESLDCLLISDLIKDLKIIELHGEQCNIEMKVDVYILSECGYTLLDMQFDIPDHLVNDFRVPDMFLNTKFLYENKEQTAIGFILPFLLKNILMEEKIDSIKLQMLDSDMSIYDQKEVFYNETGCKYFFDSDEIAFGMQGAPSYLLFQDYENKIDTKNWEVYDLKNIAFSNELTGADLIKTSKAFDDFFNFLVFRNIRNKSIVQMSSLCRMWLASLKEKAEDISKNIANNNSNQYYWKELKKIIELIDLNFLSMQTFIAKECSNNDPYAGLFFRLSQAYKKKYNKLRSSQVQNLLMLLNEVKYSINNISTPGHSYNDYMLQAETEKVNERIMLISFIAMAVPCIYALSSQSILLYVKLFSAIGIISIPLVYFLLNTAKKKIAVRRNYKMEKRRLYDQSIKELEKMKMEIKGKAPQILPQDLKDKIEVIMQNQINIKEKEVDKLKNQI